jgi:hypothetical protein
VSRTKLILQPQITSPTDRFQSSVAGIFRGMEKRLPWLDGVEVELGVAVPASSAIVADVTHGLGRAARGWVVTRVESAAVGVLSSWHIPGARNDDTAIALAFAAPNDQVDRVVLWVW